MFLQSSGVLFNLYAHHPNAEMELIFAELQYWTEMFEYFQTVHFFDEIHISDWKFCTNPYKMLHCWPIIIHIVGLYHSYSD